MPGPLDLDELVTATPSTRDRTVDLLRAVSITVVILWHWVFSVTHVDRHGAITMPNPVGDAPALARDLAPAGHAGVLLRRRVRQPGLARRHGTAGRAGLVGLRAGPARPVAPPDRR